MRSGSHFLLIVFLALAAIAFNSQNAVSQILYGRWKSEDEHRFGTVNSLTGDLTTIATIPRTSSFGISAFSNALDPAKSTLYFSATDSSDWLYSVNMQTGSVKRVLIDNVTFMWLEFDHISEVLYGRWKSEDEHQFGRVDPDTGQLTTIAAIPRSSSFGIASASNTLDPLNSILYFSANDSSNWLYSVNMETASVERVSTDDVSLMWLEFDPIAEVLYGRWKSEDDYHFGTVDPDTGGLTTMATIPRSSSFGIVSGSNTLDPLNSTLYFSANDSSNWLYSVNMDTGSVEKVLTDDALYWLEVPEPCGLAFLILGAVTVLRKREYRYLCRTVS